MLLNRPEIALATCLAASAICSPALAQFAPTDPSGFDAFRRVATFPCFENAGGVDVESLAEIVTSADRGNLLIYTDSATNSVGFIDISDPTNPIADGLVSLNGEPTSVAVKRSVAMVCVNTSSDFVNTSGNLELIDVYTRQIIRTIPLGGQPDSIAVSPDGRYAAVCIENERDEDLGSGEPPQLPAGFLVIVDLVGKPDQWTTRQVDLTGVATLFPEDPEPEFVDISVANVAAVTMQENNHIAFVYLPTGQVLGDLSAGAVDLDLIDTNENDLIEQTSSLAGVPREPDAIAWTSPFGFVTADEGDLFGGSRGFTGWSVFGAPYYESGNDLEHLAARLGHYPEDRSENKGVEPEAVEYAEFGGDRMLFVNSERANLVFVYELIGPDFPLGVTPVLRQVLPTGVGPEGLHAIPSRDLFVVACEEDDRGDGIRGSVMIYRRDGLSNYPTIASVDRDATGVPIPWAAISGLATDPADSATAYSVHDSFYVRSRFFTMALGTASAEIVAETELADTTDVLRNALEGLKSSLPASAVADFDVDALVGSDRSVNLDLEGIVVASNGNLWVCHEGSGNLVAGVSDPSDRPFESPNMLLELSPEGDILRVIMPPEALTLNQLRFGFEGLTIDGNSVYVSWQRAWVDAGDPSDRARLGRYDLLSDTWSFAYYPLDAAVSANGGWVAQADTSLLADGRVAILERDNQGGPDAAVKRIYTVDPASVTFTASAPFPTLSKSLESDLLGEGAYTPWAGFVPEKVEGLMVLANGDGWVVNDNDGVDDNSGETLLVRLPGLID
jgi:hypothetical protein